MLGGDFAAGSFPPSPPTLAPAPPPPSVNLAPSPPAPAPFWGPAPPPRESTIGPPPALTALLLLLALPVLPIPTLVPPGVERFNGPLPQLLPPPPPLLPPPPFIRGDGDPINEPFPLRLLAWRWRDGEAGTPLPNAMLPVLWKVPLWMAARVGEEGAPFLSRRLVSFRLSLRCCHCMSDSSIVLRYSRPLYLHSRRHFFRVKD